MPDTTVQWTEEELAVIGGPAVYDRIMGEIEPMLTSANLEATKAKVLAASPEERAEMATRFDLAFQEYDREVAEELKVWEEQFLAYRRASRKFVEEFIAGHEQTVLSDMEHQMTLDV